LRILIVAFSVALLASGQNAPSTAKKQSATKRHRSTAKKPQSSATRRPASTSKTTKRTPARPVAKQQQPTPERYKEIQQALADKGYFSGTPDGNWGPESVEALKRFQREQNLEPDGKIGSLSLIALGLGPKREAIQ